MSAILAAIFATKLQLILLKLVENMFLWNIIKNRVEKKKLEQILSKGFSFLFQSLICTFNFV